MLPVCETGSILTSSPKPSLANPKAKYGKNVADVADMLGKDSIKEEEEEESAAVAKEGMASSLQKQGVQGLKFKEFASFGKIEDTGEAKKPSRKRVRNKVPANIYTANVCGCEVQYKGCYNTVAFKLETIAPLVGKIMPTSSNNGEVKSEDFIKEDVCKGGFVSLNFLKTRINKHLYNKALKDMLNNYQPFEHSDVVAKSSPGTLQRDHIKVFGMDVAFIVAREKVFFDILGSFTILGELGLPLRNKWDSVDSILLENGISHRDAFRRYHKWTWTQRSHISLRALIILTEHGLVQNKTRRDTLLNLFRHISEEVEVIGRRKQQLFEELQALADALIEKEEKSSKHECRDGQSTEHSQSCHVGKSLRPGMESCGDFCGKQQHCLPSRCCSNDHSIELDEKTIGYIISKSRIFLEKHSAFSALGRMYVIRCSDYRKADKILGSSGMKIKEHYLYEKRCSHVPMPRKRRTHISLEAFIVLVNKGFAYAAKRSQLLQGLEAVVEQIPNLKLACPLYSKCQDEERPDVKPIISSPEALQGDNSVLQQQEEEEEEEAVPTTSSCNAAVIVNILDRAVAALHVRGRSYLLFKDVLGFLSEEDGREESLREKLAKLRMESHLTALPRSGNEEAEMFISVECLNGLLTKGLVAPDNKETLESQLRALENSQNIAKSTQQQQPKKAKRKVKGSLQPSTVPSKSSQYNGPSVCVLDTLVPCKVVNDILYLEEKSLCQICCPNAGPLFKTYRKIDRLIEQGNICLDDAFLYDGRKRGHISTAAVKLLIRNNVIGEGKNKKALLKRLDEIEEEKESLKNNRILNLAPFGSVAFQSCRNTVFVHTLQILKIVGFGTAYLNDRSLKIYPIICKLLKLRGLNLDSCFLKQGKSKYVYVSLDAVLSLLQTKFGPFKDRMKMSLIRSQLLDSLKHHGFDKEGKGKGELSGDDASAADAALFSIGYGFAPIPYKTREGELFVHRSTCFESIGLERSVMSGFRGFLPVNEILQKRGLEISQCYIAGERENYSFISLVALLSLLESQDPIVNCLEKKERFSEALMTALQSGVGRAILQEQQGQQPAAPSSLTLDGLSSSALPFRLQGSRLYLARQKAYEMSGLCDKPQNSHGQYNIFEDPLAPLIDRGVNASACFLADGGGDPHAFISVDALLILMNLDGDISRAADYSKLLWKNLISAVIMEAPKLKVHVKMIEFRSSLLKTLMKRFIHFLEHCQEEKSTPEDTSKEVSKAAVGVSVEEEDEDESPAKKMRLRSSSSAGIMSVLSSNIVAEDLMAEETEYLNSILQRRSGGGESSESRKSSESSSSSSLREPDPTPPPQEEPEAELSEEDYVSLRDDVVTIRRGDGMGDWQVLSCDDDHVRLVVTPGLSASRKVSFINPDVCAVLSYELIFRPHSAAQMLINSRAVPNRFISDIVQKSLSKGILCLLFNLLTLRPCFGSFSSELVETVQKGMSDNASSASSDIGQDFYIDKKFVASGQNGRTYAGTVRSRRCTVLAKTRVGDTCSECETLKRMVINRSVLSSSGKEDPSAGSAEGAGVAVGAHQKSVWKISESSSDGCTFVCPQLQSFNTSLPQQFFGSQQATTIVEHKVEISHDLKARLLLNNNLIQKTFSDFETSKQVGPLLEWVATLRFCIGYPDPVLVENARYLVEFLHVLQPEIGKFFSHVFVDENFCGKMTSGSEFKGTVRTPTCKYVAGDHADICDQCLLLQEPIEFLGVKEDRRRK